MQATASDIESSLAQGIRTGRLAIAGVLLVRTTTLLVGVGYTPPPSIGVALEAAYWAAYGVLGWLLGRNVKLRPLTIATVILLTLAAEIAVIVIYMGLFASLVNSATGAPVWKLVGGVLLSGVLYAPFLLFVGAIGAFVGRRQRVQGP